MTDASSSNRGSGIPAWFCEYPETQLEIIERNLRGSLETGAIESFHEFRVGVKRWRAFLHLVSWLNPRYDTKKLRHRVRDLYRKAGKVREAHVQMQMLREPAPRYVSGLSEYYNYLKKVEKRELPQYLTAAKRFDISSISLSREELAEAIPEIARERLLPLTETLFETELNQLVNVHVLNGNGNTDFHRIRILSKRARYLLEILRAGKGETDRLIGLNDALRELHRALGQWRDLALAAESLDQFRSIPDGQTVRDEAIYSEYRETLTQGSELALADFPVLIQRLTQYS
jgi:CHAD domain-containing protein